MKATLTGVFLALSVVGMVAARPVPQKAAALEVDEAQVHARVDARLQEVLRELARTQSQFSAPAPNDVQLTGR